MNTPGYDGNAGIVFDDFGFPVLQEEPNHCPGGYVLHFYCRYFSSEHRLQEFPQEYPGETRGECVSQARKDGWIFHKDNTGTCPKCAKSLKLGKFKNA